MDLDPTHQMKVDITHEELRASGVIANAWIRPCDPSHYGEPCDCQEGDCER